MLKNRKYQSPTSLEINRFSKSYFLKATWLISLIKISVDSFSVDWDYVFESWLILFPAFKILSAEYVQTALIIDES